jgi:DNA-binding transcriptional ArsR family regulator
LIDRITKEIQDRLDQILAEAERLRKALVALDPRGGSSRKSDGGAATSQASRATSSAAARSSSASGRSSGSRSSARTSSGGTRSSGRSGGGSGGRSTGASRSGSGGSRTAPGATRAAVLKALSDGKARTAGEVASATGLARGTVSTTLSKLARSGELTKADRGYQLRRGTSGAAGAAADGGSTS